MLPFTHRIPNATSYRAELVNLRSGAQHLGKAIAQLVALKPPTGLAAVHQRLIGALRVEIATMPKYISAVRRHDAIALSNLAAADRGNWAAVTTAIQNLSARWRVCATHLGKC